MTFILTFFVLFLFISEYFQKVLKCLNRKTKNDWNDYVTRYIINYHDPNNGNISSNVCQYGAIIGNQDGKIWASSPGFSLGDYNVEVEEDFSKSDKVQFSEFEKLLDYFNNRAQIAQEEGIVINNEIYTFVSFDKENEIINLKKNGGGASVAKTNKAFVICCFSTKLRISESRGSEQPQNSGSAFRAVEGLQKLLKEHDL
jgi:hypothetical protein